MKISPNTQKIAYSILWFVHFVVALFALHSFLFHLLLLGNLRIILHFILFVCSLWVFVWVFVFAPFLTCTFSSVLVFVHIPFVDYRLLSSHNSIFFIAFFVVRFIRRSIFIYTSFLIFFSLNIRNMWLNVWLYECKWQKERDKVKTNNSKHTQTDKHTHTLRFAYSDFSFVCTSS